MLNALWIYSHSNGALLEVSASVDFTVRSTSPLLLCNFKNYDVATANPINACLVAPS